MIYSKTKQFWFLNAIIFCFLGYTQENKLPKIDTLSELEYHDLEEKFESNASDPVLANIYAQAFLKKAKKEKNIIKQADGYYRIAKLFQANKPLALSYSDSIIKLTKSTQDSEYPAKAYLFRANLFGVIGKYKEAMEELVNANYYANRNKNVDQQYKTKYLIALLKDNLGEHDETLKIFKSIKKYREKQFNKNKQENRYDYIKSIYALGNSYNDNKKYDSAYYENKKGIELSLKYDDSILYGNFLLSSGVTHYFKKEYQLSLDSITKFKKIYSKKDKINEIYLITSDLYLGMLHYEQNKLEKSIDYLRKVDKKTFSGKNFFPGLRPAWETLIKSYRKKNNTEKQLYYIDRLLKFDSILKTDFKHLYKKINEEYSTPMLLSEKEQIINSLEANNRQRVLIIIILLAISLVLIVFLYKNNRKKKIYKNRFEELFNKEKVDKPVSFVEKRKEKKSQNIGISDSIVADIQKGLVSFENKHGFLKSNITVSSISKQLNTNSKYLSKVINTFKNKSFSSYINDLRINYVVEKLKSDTKFRRYTIKAIANDCGFNTTEAFSKSFYKSTGIYPSFFLKQLEKKESDL